MAAAAAPRTRTSRRLVRRITWTKVSVSRLQVQYHHLTPSIAVSAVQSKFGGGKGDPAKTRSTNEKFTDGARERFEKATGYGLYLGTGRMTGC